MREVFERLDFTPRRIMLAFETVVKQHPGTAAIPVVLPAEGLGALRRLVAAASSSSEALAQLALELSPRQVRGLVAGLEQWEDLRDEVVFLLDTRGKDGLVAPLWRSWQRFPHSSPIRNILVRLADRFGWENVAGNAHIQTVKGWILSADPGVRIQRWLDGQNRTYSDLDAIADCPLSPDTPLLKLVRDAILTHGSWQQLQTEGSHRLMEWNGELAPPQRLLFGRNYLTSVPVEQWDWPIVQHIERSYGLPRQPRIIDFWRPVPEAIATAFQRLFVERRLAEIFAGHSDRHAYWLRWRDSLDDVRSGKVNGTPWALLRFTRFGVMEFFETGNAAYFYESDKLAGLLSRTGTHIRELKRRSYPGYALGQDNRLIHQGPWERKADRMVQIWMQRAP